MGISLIDAPVSGGPHGAGRRAPSPSWSARRRRICARATGVSRTISPNIFHCGDVGTATPMKLVNNVVAAGVRMLPSKAVTMGIKSRP